MTEPLKFEFTNECVCLSYDEDTDTYSTEPSEYCYGDCYAEQVESLEARVLSPWREALGIDLSDEVLIIAQGMGWQGLSGWATTTADTEGVIKALSINGSYRLALTLDGKTLTANRYSHDEPTGSAVFTFSKESE
jgi:hypothetical protein